jgi:glucose/arabinose dehydrogenase
MSARCRTRALLLALCAAPGLAAAQGFAFEPAFPQLAFDKPLFVTSAPGAPERLYVATQGGRIFGFAKQPEPHSAPVFLDLRGRVTQRGGEEGLLGLAFHPDFARNRLFYVYYTPAERPRRTVLSRFRAKSAEAADPASEEVLLTIAQPYSNHNGGMLAFGPDGRLYVGVGDGGSGGDPHDNGQRLDTLLGKILRLTDAGTAPADNPFTGRAGARAEIWAYGMRNPWRFSFDRGTGALWVADVGQNKWEEVDLVVKGGNYGWRVYEGAAPYAKSAVTPASEPIAPVATYGHDAGCSITGGYVYRGKAVAALQGQYLYADFCSGTVWALDAGVTGPRKGRAIGNVPDPSSFGEDAEGEVYLTSFTGRLYRLAPRP